MLRRTLTIFIIVWLVMLMVYSVIFFASKDTKQLDHYSFLAQSLVSGNFDVTEQIHQEFTDKELQFAADYSIYESKYFVYLGVFPALLFIPILFLKSSVSTSLILTGFVLANIYLIRKITYKYLKNDSYLLAVMIFVASPMLTCVAFFGPWYLAGLIVSALGLSFVWLYVINKRAIGILLLCPMFLTRPDTVFLFLIPLYDVATNRSKRKEIRYLFITTLVAIMVFSVYNYERFGSPFEAGYKYAYVFQDEYRKHRTLESPEDYFVSNVIYLFLNPPIATINEALRFEAPFFELSRFGVGLVYVIPWIIPYFLTNKKLLKDLKFLLPILLIVLVILTFKGEGSFQIGPRYANDFFPLLLFLCLRWLSIKPKMIPTFYKLLTVSFVMNLYFYFLVISGNIKHG